MTLIPPLSHLPSLLITDFLGLEEPFLLLDRLIRIKDLDVGAVALPAPPPVVLVVSGQLLVVILIDSA